MTRRPPKRAHTVKVDDALWAAALKTADERGEVLAEEIRAFLARYARDRGPVTRFYEDDEPPGKVEAAWDAGEKGLTAPPGGFAVGPAPTTIQGNRFIEP